MVFFRHIVQKRQRCSLMTLFTIRATEDTFVISDKERRPQCHSPCLPVGKTGLGYMCYSRFISYIFFDLSEIPGHAKISSAKIKISLYDPPCLGQPPDYIGIQALKEPFRDCYTNYGNRPAVISHSLRKIPTHSATKFAIDVTDFVKAWHSGKYENHGLALVPVQMGTNGVILFHSSDSSDVSKHPALRINTVADGTCQKQCTASQEETYAVKKIRGFSKPYEIWNYTIYSYIVKNIGEKKIMVQLQFSPNNVDYLDEEPKIELLPGQSRIMISNFFARYIRLAFHLAPGETGEGTLKVWLQARQ
ncbi:DNRLRE domain-containing protein [Desulforamulus putei]